MSSGERVAADTLLMKMGGQGSTIARAMNPDCFKLSSVAQPPRRLEIHFLRLKPNDEQRRNVRVPAYLCQVLWNAVERLPPDNAATDNLRQCRFGRAYDRDRHGKKDVRSSAERHSSHGAL